MWAKSHCEAPDIEDYPVVIKYNRCVRRLSDDWDDAIGYKCGGKITWKQFKQGAYDWAKFEGKCQSCGTGYLR